jgi:formylglycine-generating enzyme required for sulfatase activity
MKNWVLVLFTTMLAGFMCMSCGDDGGSTEPSDEMPVITSLSADSTTIEAGQTAVITCTASDADGDVLIYDWQSTGGVISGSGSRITWTAPVTVGTYTITCDVSDGEGSVSEDIGIIVFETPVPGAMVSVQGGTFDMTDYSTNQAGDTVTVTVGNFSIGKYEVTQKEWSDIMGSNPASAYGVGDNYPVYPISWFLILEYCNKRSVAEGLTPCYSIAGSTVRSDWPSLPIYSSDASFAAWNAVVCDWSADGYRLPTEAEWEYAARGGAAWTDNYLYSGSDTLDDIAWYAGNSSNLTHTIGTKMPNQLGIYDMSGNLYEFCWDWYAPYHDNTTDPKGPGSGDMRIVRGGSWMSIEANCVVAGRYREYPVSIFDYNGFRVVTRP